MSADESTPDAEHSDAGGQLSRVGGLFAVIVLSVLVISAIAPALIGGTAPPAETNLTTSEPEAFLPEGATGDGTVAMDRSAAGTVVMVDLSHGNDISERTLGPLLSAMTDRGAEVQYHRSGPLEPALDNADALIVANPTRSYTSDELAAIDQFASRSGSVALLSDPQENVIRPRTAATDGGDVMTRLGFYADPGYLYNLRENDLGYLNVYATPTGTTPLTAGIDRIALRSAAPVTATGGGADILRAEATRSTTRQTGAQTVAAQSGNVVLIGDTTFMQPEYATRADNNVLIGNLAEFLAGGGGGTATTAPPTATDNSTNSTTATPPQAAD